MSRMFNPPHPGETLREDVLPALGLTVTDAAAQLGVTRAARKREDSPAFRDAYDALDDEFAALAVLLKARKDAGLTQAEVATKMGASQPVLARIESSLGNRKHAPLSRPYASTPAASGWSSRRSSEALAAGLNC